ncbi:Sugar phosphate isomerase/epimerase [Paenibacillus sp. UNCCL117]|uniref:sugar phosphate isomerase/epimerase family protein n=1 Tax=unclassified Paenibacillus TaxID=185978 RepID=UPI00089200A0|nr:MULTISPECIES: sugar phosphate isomerase/epimerase family protein [unclassified Paenibacillus]SDC66453.1 Sugar phosphate isomerase/epimerase [Paenibacillus sp. cl123]SFW23043.1 Sugar phosphate isomerase/epimerase [Paenibacillus sp. UNCCL117]
MKRGLTRAGLGDAGTTESFIARAAAYGFQTVDLGAQELADPEQAASIGASLKQHGIEAGSFGLPVEWRKTDEAFRAGLPLLAAAAAGAASIGCLRCCTYILPSTDELPAPFLAKATTRLRICAQLLGAYGIRLGLEFVGPHHLRTRWQHPFLWTMDDTLAWIDAIGEPNVGLLFDVYHAYTTGLAPAELDRLTAAQVVHVHINDAPDVPVEAVLDNERLYTGEGVIDAAAYLQALQRIGYDGPVAQEVLLPAAPTDSVEALLERSKAGFDRVFTAAGLV